MEKAERKIEEVRLITMGTREIWIYYGGKARPESFKRDKWKLVAEDIVRMENIPEARHNTVITPRAGIGVGCQVLEDEKIILCGERPEEMFID